MSFENPDYRKPGELTERRKFLEEHLPCTVRIFPSDEIYEEYYNREATLEKLSFGERCFVTIDGVQIELNIFDVGLPEEITWKEPFKYGEEIFVKYRTNADLEIKGKIGQYLYVHGDFCCIKVDGKRYDIETEFLERVTHQLRNSITFKISQIKGNVNRKLVGVLGTAIKYSPVLLIAEGLHKYVKSYFWAVVISFIIYAAIID